MKILEEEENLPCKVYVDKMTNEANLSYGAIPERLYVILDGNIAYAGGFGPMYYKLEEVVNWLDVFKNKSE